MRRHFTDKAGKALHNKVVSLVHQRNEEVGHNGLADLLAKLEITSAKCAIKENKVGWRRVADLVMFFGATCCIDEIPLGIEKLVVAINDLAERGYVTGAMMPLGIITLGQTTPFEPRYIVTSYLAINDKGQKYLEKHHTSLLFPEGGMPRRVT
jgi:hypothetical protein